MQRTGQPGAQFVLFQHTAFDQPQVGEQHPLIVDVVAVGGHRTRGESADIGVVAT